MTILCLLCFVHKKNLTQLFMHHWCVSRFDIEFLFLFRRLCLAQFRPNRSKVLDLSRKIPSGAY